MTRKDISEVDSTRLGIGVEECGCDELGHHGMLSASCGASTQQVPSTRQPTECGDGHGRGWKGSVATLVMEQTPVGGVPRADPPSPSCLRECVCFLQEPREVGVFLPSARRRGLGRGPMTGTQAAEEHSVPFITAACPVSSGVSWRRPLPRPPKR